MRGGRCGESVRKKREMTRGDRDRRDEEER
jgi:hypothetical protein